jgi:DNA (cytosine-5)-methyltransferase 1
MTKINIQPNGDIQYGTTDIIPNDGRAIDLLVGGTPCQDASVAGKRAGLVKGERSKLAFTFTRLAYELAAYRGLRWIVWENVPGIFSLNGGRDFAAFLSSLAGRNIAPPSKGWGSFGVCREGSSGNFGLAWRVLDSQFTRVDGFPKAIPQRRRRIFLVGHLGDWRRAAEVLFEPKSLLGDNPPSRKAGKATATDAERSVGNAECYATQSYSEIRKSNNASTLKAEGGVYGGGSENYVVKRHGCGEHANSLPAQGSEQPKSISS